MAFVADAPAPVVAEPAEPDPAGARAAAAPARRRPGRRWLAGAAWAVAAALVFAIYLRVSQTEPGDSYGAVFTLQAWDMLHGNLLLHGWWLSDVSFYTTELPEYLLVELVLGRGPDVVHVAGAITFTLVLLLAAALARGQASGRAAAIRAVIAAGIIGSPQPGAGVFLFLLAPDHYGSTVPVLLAWLILDRAARRWYVPAAVGVLLGWALVADSVVLLTGVLPLLTVCAVRLYHHAVQQRRALPARGDDPPLRCPGGLLPEPPAPATAGSAGTRLRRAPPHQPMTQWFDAALLAAGLLATAAAATVLHLIGVAGGFRLNPVSSQLTSIGALPGHVYQTVAGLALVFGGDFFGQPAGLSTLLLLLHLAGLALAGWAVCAGVRRLRHAGLIVQLLLAGILVNLAAFLVWTDVTSLSTTREIVAVLPFGAVLAGRCWPGWPGPGCCRCWPRWAAATWPAWASCWRTPRRPRRPSRWPAGWPPTTCGTAWATRHWAAWSPCPAAAGWRSARCGWTATSSRRASGKHSSPGSTHASTTPRSRRCSALPRHRQWRTCGWRSGRPPPATMSAATRCWSGPTGTC